MSRNKKFYVGFTLLAVFLIIGLVGCNGVVKDTSVQDSQTRADTKVPADTTDPDVTTPDKTVETLGDLQVGDKVIDTSWGWEHKLGNSYTNFDFAGNELPAGENKPVQWVVAAIDHYEGLPSHVTLLSEEIIGRHPFDDGQHENNATGYRGSNHWGTSGTAGAEHGLRPFLNSFDKAEGYQYSGDGFLNAFSENFRNAVLLTTLNNATKIDEDGIWDEENPWQEYTTQDYVFVPSMAEYGNERRKDIPEMGSLYPYFDPDHPSYPSDAYDAWIRESRGLDFGDDTYVAYFSRTPSDKFFESVLFPENGSSTASSPQTGIRPALNIQAGVRVSPEPNPDGYYEIIWD